MYMSYPTPRDKAATAAQVRDAGGATLYACTNGTCTNVGGITNAAGVTPNRVHRGMTIHISITTKCEFHAGKFSMVLGGCSQAAECQWYHCFLLIGGSANGEGLESCEVLICELASTLGRHS